MPPHTPGTKAGKATNKLQNQLQAEESARNELYGGDGSHKDTKEPETAESQVTTDKLVKKEPHTRKQQQQQEGRSKRADL